MIYLSAFRVKINLNDSNGHMIMLYKKIKMVVFLLNMIMQIEIMIPSASQICNNIIYISPCEMNQIQ